LCGFFYVQIKGEEMTEPASHATAVVTAAATATVTGSMFGIEYLYLMWGFVGGVTALIYLPQFSKWWQTAASVTGATVLGGVMSPISIVTVVHFAPWLDGTIILLKVVVAFLIGLLAQKGVPSLFRYLESKGSTA